MTAWEGLWGGCDAPVESIGSQKVLWKACLVQERKGKGTTEVCPRKKSNVLCFQQVADKESDLKLWKNLRAKLKELCFMGSDSPAGQREFWVFNALSLQNGCITCCNARPSCVPQLPPGIAAQHHIPALCLQWNQHVKPAWQRTFWKTSSALLSAPGTWEWKLACLEQRPPCSHWQVCTLSLRNEMENPSAGRLEKFGYW